MAVEDMLRELSQKDSEVTPVERPCTLRGRATRGENRATLRDSEGEGEIGRDRVKEWAQVY
jgi:hypothetical protein